MYAMLEEEKRVGYLTYKRAGVGRGVNRGGGGTD